MQETNHNEKWFRVALRFQGDDLPVDEIENRLNIKPSSLGRLGEHVGNNYRHAKYHTNIWVWSITKDSSVPFDKQIEDVLELLEPKRDALVEILSLPDVEGELFLGFSSSNGQGGAHFPPSLLSRIGALGLAVTLDLYAPTLD